MYSQGFTRDTNKRTIDTKDKLLADTIGQRARISFIDAKQINSVYCAGV